MELTAQNIFGLLLRSKLLPLETAREAFQRWQTEAGPAGGDGDKFLRWLVARQHLTEYQANLLHKGHADGFFLNQYRILDRLGRGRMAGVYLAEHHLGQRVAIKVLPPSKAKDPALLGRFQREARLALKLKHPNVVRAFQVGEANGVHFFVMEYLDGEPLDEVLQRRRQFPPAEAVRLIYQVLQGLQHLHDHGVVHRDVKPANLMLVPPPSPGPKESTNSCTVKMLDIGLGRALFEETNPEKPADIGLTTEGVLLGTPDYMAPEQARNAHAADIRSDIYSVGCVLYHLLAGKPPFPDTNLLSQMIRHATETPRPLRELNPAVPDGLQQIVSWMMAKDPAQRYATPDRAAQALQVYLATGAETAANPEADPKMRTYLTWLEVEDRKPPPADLPVSGATVPATRSPVAGIVPASPQPAADQQRRVKKQRRNPEATPVAATATTPGAKPHKAPRKKTQFDVELVPVNLPDRPPAAAANPPLGVRDLIAFAVGGGSVPVAIFLGWLLANLGDLQLSGRDCVWFALGVGLTLVVGAGGFVAWRQWGGKFPGLQGWFTQRLRRAKPTPTSAAPPATVGLKK